MINENAVNYVCKQTGNGNRCKARKCTCDIKAPPARVLQSPEYNIDLAQFYVDLNLSGDGTVNWVLTELYDKHNGRLFVPDGTEILIETDDGADTSTFDEAFGADARRFINRYREKAARPPKNLLDRRCIFPVTLLHFAREIHLCRSHGRCSL